MAGVRDPGAPGEDGPREPARGARVSVNPDRRSARFVQDVRRRVVDAGVMPGTAFTPALGRLAPVRFYDAVAALTRERLWRALVVAHVAPRPGDVIVDVGCGTGS